MGRIAARTSLASCSCSCHAAKWLPLSTSLRYICCSLRSFAPWSSLAAAPLAPVVHPGACRGANWSVPAPWLRRTGGSRTDAGSLGARWSPATG